MFNDVSTESKAFCASLILNKENVAEGEDLSV